MHIVLDTGEIVDIPDDLSERLMSSLNIEALREIESTLGVDIRDLRIELRGTSCQRADSQ